MCPVSSAQQNTKIHCPSDALGFQASPEGLTFWGWTSSMSRDCPNFCEQGVKLRLADKIYFQGAIQMHADTLNTVFCTVCTE